MSMVCTRVLTSLIPLVVLVKTAVEVPLFRISFFKSTEYMSESPARGDAVRLSATLPRFSITSYRDQYITKRGSFPSRQFGFVSLLECNGLPSTKAHFSRWSFITISQKSNSATQPCVSFPSSQQHTKTCNVISGRLL